MPLTILITGFGPFPTARVNPTAALASRLARLRRPALSDTRLVAHVFATRYDAVDRELPQLLAQHQPDAILMFGLAARRRWVSIETRARNAVSALLPDASGALARQTAILPGGPAAHLLAPWCRKLARPLHAARVPARLSRDAGRYVCNYLCWRAAEAAALPHGPLIAFIHVPQVARGAIPLGRARGSRINERDLVRAGIALLETTRREASRERRNCVRSRQVVSLAVAGR